MHKTSAQGGVTYHGHYHVAVGSFGTCAVPDLDDEMLNSCSDSTRSCWLFAAAEHDSLIREVLTEPAGQTEDDPVQVVSEITRLHGLLDLAWTDDVQLLYDRINGCIGDVVLTEVEEAAYQRTIDRRNNMWTLSSALDRFRY
jgi:hypothetical protein